MSLAPPPASPIRDGEPGDGDSGVGEPGVGDSWIGRSSQVLAGPWAAVVLASVVVAPLVVALLASWGRTWFPSGDWAMLVLGAEDTFTSGARLVGPYSREGWSHPGPLLFWSSSIPLWLSGGATWMLMSYAAAVNILSVIGALWLAWRRGRIVAVTLVGAALASVIAAMETGMAADPWNPWITVLPTALFVMAATSVLAGDRLALPVMVVVGTFMTQSHVGYLPMVIVVAATVTAMAWRRGRIAGRWLLWGGLVPASVLWLPPLIDQFLGSGNLTAIVSGFGANTDRPAGFFRAIGTVARQLSWNGPWRGGEEPQSPTDGAIEGGSLVGLTVAVALFVGSALFAHRRRCRAPLHLQMVLTLSVLVGVVAVSRITGPIFDYLIRWWWPLAALWWASIGWSLVAAASSVITERATARRGVHSVGAIATAIRIVLAVVALAILVPQAWTTSSKVYSYGNPGAGLESTVAAITSATQRALDDRRPEGTIIELSGVGDTAGWVVDALGLQLIRDGWTVVVAESPTSVGKWGARRSVGTDELPVDRVTIWVVRTSERPEPVPLTARTVFRSQQVPGGPVEVLIGEPGSVPAITER